MEHTVNNPGLFCILSGGKNFFYNIPYLLRCTNFLILDFIYLSVLSGYSNIGDDECESYFQLNALLADLGGEYE